MGEQVGTGDMAMNFGQINQNGKSRRPGTLGIKHQKALIPIQPDSEFNGKPCFNIDCPDEYNSFARGIKSFHRWSQHTKSENIRHWANQNKGKSFYITHNGSYTKVQR
jgi:hypothetical protein